MKSLTKVFLISLLLACQSAIAKDDAPAAEEEQYAAWAADLWKSLDKQQGEIKLLNGVATLKVPEDFFYLKPADAEKVLVEVWGNLPGAGADSLGMLFPSGVTAFDEGAWAVTIKYEDDGFVSDEDADKMDYQELLSQMKQDTHEASEERVHQGYEPIELVGWASPPYYDKAAHKLHWSKEVKFGDQAVNTLNYNIRVLGRKGVLVLNFIAGMDQKALIDTKVDSVLAMANFDQGSTYDEFNPSLDKVAAYGIGALVAGKVIAKTGILVAALVFLKKFGIIALIAIGAFARRLFRKKPAV